MQDIEMVKTFMLVFLGAQEGAAVVEVVVIVMKDVTGAGEEVEVEVEEVAVLSKVHEGVTVVMEVTVIVLEVVGGAEMAVRVGVALSVTFEVAKTVVAARLAALSGMEEVNIASGEVTAAAAAVLAEMVTVFCTLCVESHCLCLPSSWLIVRSV